VTQIRLISQSKDRHAANMARRRRVVAAIGAKQVAGELDVTEAALSHMLAERGRHWPSWADEVLLELDPTGAMEEVLASQAARRGMELLPEVKIAPEDEVAAWREYSAEEMGKTTRPAALARVRELALDNARRRSR
jgi:hypothetical protein